MTSIDAKRILLLYRAGTPAAQEPDLKAALELASRNPELRRWYEEHCAAEQALRERLRSLQPPPALREAILARERVIRGVTWYRKPWALAAAALIALSFAFSVWWSAFSIPNGFDNYRSRMVSGVLRSYHMDIETNDPQQVRDFMASRGAPADYIVPPGLAHLQLSGGGLLQWRGHRVSMVCFDRGNNTMLFLFVLPQGAVRDRPPAAPQIAKVNKLLTASWSHEGHVYLLAGPPDADFARNLL